MIRKADERKLQEDKKTIFRYRGGIEIPSTKLERFNKAAKVELSEISYGCKYGSPLREAAFIPLTTY